MGGPRDSKFSAGEHQQIISTGFCGVLTASTLHIEQEMQTKLAMPNMQTLTTRTIVGFPSRSCISFASTYKQLISAKAAEIGLINYNPVLYV